MQTPDASICDQLLFREFGPRPQIWAFGGGEIWARMSRDLGHRRRIRRVFGPGFGSDRARKVAIQVHVRVLKVGKVATGPVFRHWRRKKPSCGRSVISMFRRCIRGLGMCGFSLGHHRGRHRGGWFVVRARKSEKVFFFFLARFKIQVPAQNSSVPAPKDTSIAGLRMFVA